MSALSITQVSNQNIAMNVIPLPVGEHITSDDLLAHKVLRLQRSEVGPFLRQMDTEELEFQKMEMKAFAEAYPKAYAVSSVLGGIVGGAGAVSSTALVTAAMVEDTQRYFFPTPVAEAIGFGIFFETVFLAASAVAGVGTAIICNKLVESTIESHPDIKPCRLERLKLKVLSLTQRIDSNESSEIEQVQMQAVRRIYSNTIKDHS